MPRVPRPALAAAAALALAAALPVVPAATAGDTHEPRVALQPYVAGVDFVCASNGVGCAQFFVQGDETMLHVSVEDENLHGIGTRVCTPDCGGTSVDFCGARGGIPLGAPGDLVTVFLDTATGPLAPCPGFLHSATKGVVVATFT